MPSGSPSAKDPRAHAHPALRWSNWNLLLLVPLLMLITPVFNRDEPRLLGFPFFYWYQFLWVPIGVLCVAIVFAKTKHITGPADRDAPKDGSR
ncbi:MAG: DUF3311 domain-containing protein [Actinomycetota bacterium]|nr:DUF3311 domain-containing protein [Actinomycetota bacterium]